MKTFKLALIIIYINCECSEINKSEFTYIECGPEEKPEFDFNKVTLLDDGGNPIGDSIIDSIEKRRTVFKPCRELIFRAKFTSEKNELISNSRIKMMATGKRWEFQPEKQDEIMEILKIDGLRKELKVSLKMLKKFGCTLLD